MKLLIDIPEHIYEHAKETTEDSRDEFDAMRAIANGIQQESRSEIPNTCGDAISRKHLLEEIALLKKSPWFNENTYGSKVIRKEAVEIVEDVCIKREPSVTPQQRTGRWRKVSMDKYIQYSTYYYECSECGDQHIGQVNYCPNCGAKMEVEE
jgi:hypothetical protein